MLADRAQHVAEVIRPALDARRGRGVRPVHAVDAGVSGRGARARCRRGRAAERVGRGGLEPDVVIVLDLPDDVAEARVAADRDRFERAGRRVPRRGARRVPATWRRSGAGSSSTPTARPTTSFARGSGPRVAVAIP